MVVSEMDSARSPRPSNVSTLENPPLGQAATMASPTAVAAGSGTSHNTRIAIAGKVISWMTLPATKPFGAAARSRKSFRVSSMPTVTMTANRAAGSTSSCTMSNEPVTG